MNKTLIIDYSLGNLLSVSNAIEVVGGNPLIINRPEDLKNASRVILPGVGAFGDGIEKLSNLGWIDAIKDYISSGNPFLGICLGMQLLATEGNEHGTYPGLGIIEGSVERLTPCDGAMRIPHIGWNEVAFKGDGLLDNGLTEHEDFYFVHSYAFMAADEDCVSGICDYGGTFAAILECENVFATQFHPEKSQRAGLALLKNFVEIG